MSPVESLQGLAEDVSRRVPEDVLSVLRVKFDQFQLATGLEGAIQIPQGRPIQTRSYNRIGQTLTNPARDLSVAYKGKGKRFGGEERKKEGVRD